MSSLHKIICELKHWSGVGELDAIKLFGIQISAHTYSTGFQECSQGGIFSH
jgi:hypothetical protein